MSRAINLSLPPANVLQRCAESGISISAIEPLPSGGTHLVCATGEGAEEMRLRLANNLINGPVRRFPFHRTRGPLWVAANKQFWSPS